VRVIDFGIASHETSSNADSVDLVRDEGARAYSVDTQLTQAGTLIGTPAYMAPEQLQGGGADARSDQFAFGVTAYRALYGVKPFAGGSVKLRLQAIADGPPEPPAEAPRVPRHVHRALCRALAPKAEDRFASMDDLLVELRRDPTARRVRIAGGAAVVAVAAVAFVLFRGSSASAPDPCATATRSLDELWTPARRQALGRAAAAFDRFAAPWREMRVEACRATHVDHTQSEEILDVRMRCLDDQLGPMRELLAIYGEAPTPDEIDGAVRAAAALPSVAGCADVRSLLAQTPLPADANVRVEIASAQIVVERARALRLAGRVAEARELLEGKLPAIRALDHPPLLAKALHEMSGIRDWLGDVEGAEAFAWETVTASARAGDLTYEVWSISALIWTIGVHQERFGDAEILARMGRAALARGGDPPLARSQFLNNVGFLHYTKGELTLARQALEEAVALREATFGATSLKVAQTLGNLAEVLIDLDLLDEGLAAAERARSIYEQLFGSANPETAGTLMTISRAHRMRGDLEAALAAARGAVEIAEAAPGANAILAWSCLTRAAAEAPAGELASARADLARAAELLGPQVTTHKYQMHIQQITGEIERRAGNRAKAREALRLALEHAEALGRDSLNVVDVLVDLGELELADRKPAAAAAVAERGVELATRIEASPGRVAKLRSVLARAGR
jgi:eukaryotic-like serine/threonine-protein kinase